MDIMSFLICSSCRILPVDESDMFQVWSGNLLLTASLILRKEATWIHSLRQHVLVLVLHVWGPRRLRSVNDNTTADLI